MSVSQLPDLPPVTGSRYVAAPEVPLSSPSKSSTSLPKPLVVIPLYLKLITGGVAGVIGTTVILCVAPLLSTLLGHALLPPSIFHFPPIHSCQPTIPIL